ncbi:plasmid replication DNA-binding protein (plasmid) [Acinetobacter schindleri]|nr:plasmid replication DNA-binding protein [Acinetobacter schindleri]UOH76524.1 plasmid replication DNA-binding protein [Acinetobacter schindleri]UOH76532.1 plasmid replication DNA-binding protein [Acinetobacter schindleri]
MKALTVIELAKLYGMNRQSIYKRINKGDLTKNSDGKIDFAEAIRVFGEPSQRSTQNVTTLQSQTVQKSAEVDILKQQVDMLKKQLELAQEREVFQREQLQAKDEQIESLQRLLGAPKPQQQAEQVQELTPEPIQPILTPVPESKSIIQESQPEPQKRRSLFGRVIRAVLD